MSRVQFATRVDEDQARLFKDLTASLGTTPPDALRMFIASFNSCGGFPYEVRTKKPVVEAFADEHDATRFATSLAMEMIDEAR